MFLFPDAVLHYSSTRPLLVARCFVTDVSQFRLLQMGTCEASCCRRKGHAISLIQEPTDRPVELIQPGFSKVALCLMGLATMSFSTPEKIVEHVTLGMTSRAGRNARRGGEIPFLWPFQA